MSVKKQTVSPDFDIKNSKDWVLLFKGHLFFDSTKRTYVVSTVNKKSIKIKP